MGARIDWFLVGFGLEKFHGGGSRACALAISRVHVAGDT